MGRLIVVLALAGGAALVTHPGGDARAHSNLPGAKVQAASPEDHVLAAARRDLEKRQSELGLVGAAPLFGAEGLPKP